jgi:hypothetical protein
VNTVLLGPRPAELEALLEQRRPCQQDRAWWQRGNDSFEPVDVSPLLGIDVAEVASLIDWP